MVCSSPNVLDGMYLVAIPGNEIKRKQKLNFSIPNLSSSKAHQKHEEAISISVRKGR